jgi:hypothetical protein
MDALNIHWRRQLFYDLDLSSIHLNSPFGHNVPENDAFVDHKMAFFLVQD